MAQNYTRQSTFSDGDTITSSLFNDEYNQLVNVFTYSSTSASTTGHRHDGTAGQGGNIFKIGDLDFLNKIEVDSTNNRWGFYVEVSSAAVEQIRIQDGSVVPVTTNDIDLGTSSLQFKDLYIDGTANVDSLTLTSGSTVTTILDEDDLSSDSATALVTQQSVKAYVDAQVTAQDLDFQADSGGALSIDLDSEALTFTGGTGVDTSGSGNAVTFAIDSTVATLTGTQTLTNKTLTSPDVNTPDIDGGTIDGTVIGGATPAAVSATTVSATGNITVGGTVDGRDVATDGTKLDGIEASATADQTAAEIRTLVGSASDSNVFTDADHSKLDGIEASATADQTAAEIRTLVESASDSNVFTDADHTKLNAIEASATADQTDAEIRAAVEAATDSNVFTDADHTKLNAIEASADVTDTANVTAAGALMDSELTSIASVKALNQGVATTDSPTFAGLTTTADVSFGDNDKALFGAGSDLQIYHDGSNSYIDDAGTGLLAIRANSGVYLQKYTGETLATFVADAGAAIYFDNAARLATTSTGIDVTGTVTADGLTVDTSSGITINGTGTSAIHQMTRGTGATNGSRPVLKLNANSSGDAVDGLGPSLQFTLSDTGVTDSELGAIGFIRNGGDGAGMFAVAQDSQSLSTTRQFTVAANGDISFYEDTGTTAKFFWDASAESLGIGTSSPANDLHIKGAGAATIRLEQGNGSNYGLIKQNQTSQLLQLGVGGSFGINIDSANNVGIGTSSPSEELEISAAIPTIRLTDTDDSSYANIFYNSPNLILDSDAGNSDGSSNIQLRVDGTEAMHIDASGNVGIGTNSPRNDANFKTLQIGDSSTAASQLVLDDNDSNGPWRIISNLSLIINDDTDERMRIDSSGNVGIGTSSPSGPLNVHSASGDANLYVTTGNTAASTNIFFGDSGNSTIGRIVYDHNGDYMQFRTNGSDAIRIDSSQNLLVGKTSADDFSSAGAQIEAGGQFTNSVASAPSLRLNRGGNDGDIIELNKAGTTVGSIGVDNSDNLYISGGSGHGGVEFGSNAVIPSSNGVAADATVKLGNANYRYTDLYLSGGVYLGGTGSANKLDDYEEGTWTPVYEATTTNPTFGSYTLQQGYYTKVGNLVYVSGRLRTTNYNSDGSGDLQLAGLPFTAKNVSIGASNGTLDIAISNAFATQIVTGTAGDNTALVALRTDLNKTTATVASLNTGSNQNDLAFQ